MKKWMFLLLAAVIAALGFSGMAGANKVNPNDTKHSGSNYILPVVSVSPARGEVSVRRDSVLEIAMDTNTQAWRTFRQQFEDGKIGLRLDGGGTRTVFVSDAISYSPNGILTVRPEVLRPYTTYTATLAAKSALQTMLKQDAIPATDEGRFYHSWSFTTGAMPNTFPGTNVVVSSGGVTVTFANVSSNGDTVILADDSPPPAPAGFFAGDSSAYYDISTTAGYTPPVTVCIPYDLLPDQDPDDARLFIYENGAWHDITTTNDTANRIICGQATILSRFAVFRADRTPPVLMVPSDLTAEATSSAGAAVTYNVTAADEVDPDPTVACNPPSGSTFPLGPTTVICTATDDAGNSATKSFAVTVVDTTPPVLAVPPDITVEAASADGTAVSYVATATDVADPNPMVTCVPASGLLFPIGTTTVTCTATDAAGKISSGSFTVTILDATPPVLVLPSDITAEAASSAGATVTYSATATDNMDPNPIVTCSPPSGLVFPISTTTVTCNATDAVGNTSDGSFTVTVRDTTPPVLMMPSSIIVTAVEGEEPQSVPITDTVEATSASGVVISYSATATDGIDPNTTVTYDPPSGSTFPVGTTTVTVTATDAYGNVSTSSFTVTVADRTPPALTMPFSITPVPIEGSSGGGTEPPPSVPVTAPVEATSSVGAVVTYIVTATDKVDASPIVACAPPSGSMFPIGTTTVICTATDKYGNKATGSFTVTVVDTTAPVLNLPPDITVEATSTDGAVVAYSATASDSVNPDLTVMCNPPSGSTFPVGTTTVTCAATDASGNTVTGSFTINVTLTADTTAPGEVRNLAAWGGHQSYGHVCFNFIPTACAYVRLGWIDPGDSDLVKIQVSWRIMCTNCGGGGPIEVAPGAQTLTVTGLRSFFTYKFRVRTVDTAGNVSVGKCIEVTPSPYGGIGVPIGC